MGDRAAGRVIAFEGVDGSGKSTMIRMVAERLHSRGVPTFLPRMGKEHVSRPVRQVRRLTRDRRNLELGARAELLLYCAREAQVLDELVRPALARGETVLLDRSLLTPYVLGAWGRGLSRQECDAAVGAATGGIEPDLTIVFDVHPRTSRIRKRIEKVRTHDRTEGGRKGLGGSDLKTRVRDGYLAVARERGYPVFHTERATPVELLERVAAVVEHGAAAMHGSDPDEARPQWMVDPELDLLDGLAAVPLPVALFLGNGLLAARDLRATSVDTEPELATWSMDPEDPLRELAAAREPEYALRAWAGRPLSGPDDLRIRLLDRTPGHAIRALRHLDDPAADELRTRYVGAVPGAVITSLAGREDATAAALRERYWSAARPEEQASSLTFCTGAHAWAARERLLERDPVLAIETLRGVDDPRAREIQDAHALTAPKAVLRSLAGRSDDHAHGLREELADSGREVVDSVRGLDDERSWALRRTHLEAWPSTVVHSLTGVPPSKRVSNMRERCRRIGAGNLLVMRRLQWLDEFGRRPQWSTARKTLGGGVRCEIGVE